MFWKEYQFCFLIRDEVVCHINVRAENDAFKTRHAPKLGKSILILLLIYYTIK